MSHVDQTNSHFRSAPFTGINTIPGAYGDMDYLRTPYAGTVRALAPPPLPQVPMLNNNSPYTNMNGMNNSYGNNFAYGGYGGGFGGYGGMYNRYNAYGGAEGRNALDPEYQFIQLAEASTRTAFQSIEALVAAVGNISAMLDSTFFALTSSFRAILGVAANIGRLRGVFTQFWQTFAVIRGSNWLYKKILYWFSLSNDDTTKSNLSKTNNTNDLINPNAAQKRQSSWPVLAFLSFIFMAPYLTMKLLGTVTKTAQEEARNPTKWVRAVETVAVYDFQARNASELSFAAGQLVTVAPKEIQNTLMLLNSGWALATLDGRNSGLIPLNYVKSPKQMQEAQQQQMQTMPMHRAVENSIATEIGTQVPAAAVEMSFSNVSNSVKISEPQIDLNTLEVTAFAPPPPSTMVKNNNLVKVPTASQTNEKSIIVDE